MFRARPLLSSGGHLVGLQFPLAEVRHRVDDDPWDATSEINDLETEKIVSAIPRSSRNGRQRSAVLSGAVKPNIRLAHPRKK